jgi:hypothetical protein
VEVLGDAVGASEESDEVLRNIERLDGADAEAGEIGLVEDTAQEIENVGTRGKIAAPRAEVDAAKNDFLRAGIAEAVDFGENSFGRKTAAFPTDEGDDAEGTAVIAAILNFESRASVIPFSAEDWGN